MGRLSLRWRLSLLCLLAIVPMTLMTLVLQNNFLEIIRSQASRYATQYVEKIGYDIELTLGELDKLSVALVRDADVRAALLEQDGGVTVAKEKLSEALRTVPLAGELECAALLLDRSQRIIASTYEEWTGLLRILGTQWLDKIIAARGGKVLISGYSITKGSDHTMPKVISIARGVFQNDVLQGYVMVEMPIEQLTKLCRGVSLGQNGFVALVDADNVILYNTRTEQIGNKYFSVNPLTQSPFSGIQSVDGVRMLLVEVGGQYSGIRVVGAIPASELDGEVVAMRRSTTLIIVLIIALMVAAFMWIVRYISRPVSELCAVMAKVEAGDFSARVRENCGSELGRLQHGFNGMVEKVDELISKEYTTALREREAELNEMMAIINPHFIYNTLEAISMTAYLNDDGKVVEMTSRLADIIRAMTQSGSRFLTLRQELNVAKSYLELVNIRVDGQIKVQWQIDESLLACRVMKFTLQPIVENSVTHGFKDRPGGQIWITLSRLSQERLLLCVEDDGQGMSKEALAALRAALDSGDRRPGKQVMALKNVHDRLRLVFGAEYGLTVDSRDPRGMCVRVVLPLKHGEGESA